MKSGMGAVGFSGCTSARVDCVVMEGAKYAVTAAIGPFLLGVSPFAHETEVGREKNEIK